MRRLTQTGSSSSGNKQRRLKKSGDPVGSPHILCPFCGYNVCACVIPNSRLYAHKTEQDKKRLDVSATKALKLHQWPGNVRELKDVILFAAFHTSDDVITASDLNFSQSEPEPDTSLRLQEPEKEKTKIIAALQQSNGNKTQAARLLGIDRSTLRYKLKQFGLD